MSEESNVLGKFGSIIGKGASKAGKKAAQSEAGKRATKAAVKGACDGVRDDMMNRYAGGIDDPVPVPTTPATPATPTASTSTSKSQSEARVDSPYSPYDRNDDKDLYNEYYSQKAPPPPKPSLFNKLNIIKKRKESSNSTAVRRPRGPVDPKKRIYKKRLADAPNWDRLELAQTLYNFKGEMKCDLQFRKGQVIQIITKTDSQDDWWEGKLEDRVGIFPSNYVKIM